MFYSHVILARKGPLGKIWLAAHFDKKLSKNQIFSTDISTSVQTVLNPSTPLALRVSGHLMLGIVRIYSKKVKYLMIDCTEALWKMKLAFKPGRVDIDPNIIAINIDDHRHYGNISMDLDFPLLDNIGFASQLLPMDMGKAYQQDDYSIQSYRDGVEDELLSQSFESFERKPNRTSEIELVRGEASHGSVSTGPRTPLSVEGRKSSIAMTKFEDDLPAFEGEEFTSFTFPKYDKVESFGKYEDDIPLNVDDYFEESKQHHPENQDVEIQRAVEPLITSKSGPKKSKVNIDDRVELSDKVFKQRLNEVAPILRRKPFEPLPFHADSVMRSNMNLELSLFEDTTALCQELKSVYDKLTATELPFPSKRPKTIQRPPSESFEVVRGMSSDQLSIEKNPQMAHDFAPSSTTKDFSQEFDIMPDISFMSDKGRASEVPFDDAILPLRKGETQQDMLEVLLKPQSIPDASGTKKSISSDRTKEFLKVLDQEFQQSNEISLGSLCKNVSRNIAARCFLEVLQLKTWGAIDISQSQPFSDIKITQCK